VQAEDTVCTLAHLKRLQEQGLGSKRKGKEKEVKERVHIRDAGRKPVKIPEDEVEREQYRLTQNLLWDFLWRRGTSLDIAPAGQTSRITYLIDGIKADREPLGRQEGDATVHYLKRLAGLNLEERRKPQRGELHAAVGENQFDIVAETAGSTAGERLRLKVLGLEKTGKIGQLGFTEDQLARVKAAMETRKGLVLLSAPRGQGRSTTTYSFVRSHDAFLQNIQMLEYAPEIEVENVTQKFHKQVEGNTFLADMQKIIRSDPDIVVFPEIRETDAATLAAQAGAEKTKIYVGLEADDVIDALRRWIRLVNDTNTAIKGLVLITNQRLVRRLCTVCKQPYKPDPGMLRKMNMPADTVLYRQPEPEYDKRGEPVLCDACQGSGYVGRTAVFETLVVDDAMRKIIRTASSIGEIQQAAAKRGGVGLQAQAMHKVLDGTTSIQEIVRVVRGQGNSGRAGGGKPARSASKPSSGKQTA
jgi:type II secretory ATPase GspE/PulE/Tfp pilus assembly ATPase PilB-like protein